MPPPHIFIDVYILTDDLLFFGSKHARQERDVNRLVSMLVHYGRSLERLFKTKF